MTYDDYQQARYFPSLDGLRAISILLVLAAHAEDPLWSALNGGLGVTLFFIISGYLITTLLLRESASDGRVSLPAFYIRRAFRILPLYYAALAAYIVAVSVLGLGRTTGTFGHRIIYFLTYTNEFAGSGAFSQSWSLGIEEKFYLVWPLLAFGPWVTVRGRRVMVVLLFAIVMTSWTLSPSSYLPIYVPILLGCALALVLDHRVMFSYLSRIASSTPAALVAAAMVAAMLFVDQTSHFTHLPFAFVAAVAFPAFLLPGGPVAALLSKRILRWVGRRSYAIYLFHPLVRDVVDHGLHRGSHAIATEIARYALLLAGSLAVAEVAARLIEEPSIRVGHRISDARKRRKDPAPSSVRAQSQSASPIEQSARY